jgi:hypothetical protein
LLSLERNDVQSTQPEAPGSVSNVKRAAHKVGRTYDYLAIARSHEVVLAAGMPRSGSTWFYNLTRLCLLESGKQIRSGWIEDEVPLRRHSERTLLIKLHDYEVLLPRVADWVIYSYRDVRDVLASIERMWGRPPSIDVVRDLLRDDGRWCRAATFTARYEDMMVDQLSVASALRGHLGLDPEGTEECVERLNELTPPARESGTPTTSYAADTLLHPGHRTDGRVGSWRGALDPDLVSAIDREFGWWLAARGYPAGDGSTAEHA